MVNSKFKLRPVVGRACLFKRLQQAVVLISPIFVQCSFDGPITPTSRQWSAVPSMSVVAYDLCFPPFPV